MCGIAGIVFKKEKKHYDFEAFEKSVGLMAHRGPDNYGKNIYKNTGFFHYRLSIIDLEPRSNQPFSLSDNEQLLVYNGELYNHKVLSDKYSVETNTTSDTEVLAKLYSRNKLSVLPEFNGIFAFAFLDKKLNTLSLVRDRLGVKPLYYYESGNYFIFASEAKVILNYIPEIQLDSRALAEYLWFGSSISDQTIAKNLKKLTPGTVLDLDLNNLRYSIKEYWSISKDILPLRNEDNYTEAIVKTKSLFEKSVERQCISDVPVGAYLSGGVDSSAVVAFASQYANGKLNTFSVDFDFTDGTESELPEARRIAKKFATQHHEFKIETKNLEEDIASIVFQYDEPFADPAALPLHLMAKKCSGITKVVLQGDGGDELFAGYGRHLDLSELKIRKFAAQVLGSLYPGKSYREAMKNRSHILNQKNSADRMAMLVAHDINIETDAFFTGKSKDFITNENAFEEYQKRDRMFNNLHPMQRMLYTDMEIILRHTFLEKVDKINMLHSIEARVPFLDNDLVDYVMKLPHNYKIKNGTTKSFLREVLKDVVPNDILYMRKKSFGTPMSSWLRTTLFDYVKDKIHLADRKFSFLNAQLLLKQLNEHKEGVKDHSSGLWRATVLIIWLDIYKEKLWIQ